jgi:hypothetical protein
VKSGAGGTFGVVAKRLEFSGEVDAYGYDTDLCDKSPVIGGENVVSRLQKEFGQEVFSKPEVTVYLGAEPLKTGPLWTLHGFGGTDVTPPESPEIKVGDLDLIGELRNLEGRQVVLIVEAS